MARCVAVILGVCGGWFLAPAAWGDALGIDLKVEAGKESQSAQAEPLALGVTPKERKVLTSTTGQSVKVQWVVTNKSPKTEMKNMTVHFVAVKAEKVGQRQVPKLTLQDVVAESALALDFSPGEKAGGSLTFKIDRPGVYFLRLEPKNAPEGEECFAAVDLVVK